MDENKELEGLSSNGEQQNEASQNPESTQPTEAFAEEASSAIVENASADVLDPMTGAAPQPAKSNKPFFILGGIVALLIAAILCVVAFSGLLTPPEKSVRKALDTTGAQMETLSQQMLAEIPALKAMQPSKDARSTKLKFSIDSLQMPSMEGMQAELVNSIAKMFSLDVDSSVDPAANISQTNSKINMGSEPLIDFFLQMSKDQLAFNAPKFSTTALSINPSTFAQDFKNSVFYSEDMDDEMLEDLQSAISAQISSLSAYNNLDATAMQKEIYAILDTVLLNAVYEKPVKEDAVKVYNIQLDGEQVKTTLVNMLQYIYVDSAIGKIYTGEMQKMLQESIIDPVKSLPALPAKLVIKVDNKSMISQLTFTLEPIKTETLELGAITMDYLMGNQLTNQKMSMNFSYTTNGMTQAMDMNVLSDYIDGASKTKMDMTMNIDDGSGIAMDTKMNMDMMMDKAGACDVTMSMDMGMPSEPSMNTNFTVAVKGTVTGDGTSLTCDFPTLSIKAGYAGTDMFTLGCKLNSQTSALAQPLQPVADAKPLLSMTEEELTTEMDKYSTGMNTVMEALFGVLMSGAA